jgi:hypothetical protein
MGRLSFWRRCIVLVIVAARAIYCYGEPAPAILGNGSFEDGQDAPVAWTPPAGGKWEIDLPHRGQRYARVDAPESQRWESKTISISSDNDFRLEGWLRASAGQARLGVDLLDADGRLLRSIAAPPVEGLAEWRYVAVEFNASAAQAKVWLAGRGPADFDDIALAPIAVSYLGNRDLQPDAKGRIGLWDEEKDPTIAPGERAGSHRSDPTAKRRDVPSLLVECTAAWYAVSSVNYGLPEFTNRLEISAWARTDESATAQILACWMDDGQQVIGVNAGPELRASEWQHLKFTLESWPKNAHTVRLVALARGGRVWFDDCNLLHLHPAKPVLRVFVNQVGYELAGTKTAVVASNFFPAESTTLNVQLVGSNGDVVLEKQASCSGRIYSGQPDDWGWYFWRVDFNELQKLDDYRIVCQYGETRGESFPFVVERSAILRETATNAVDFFFVQRCGCEVPGWHAACHLDDAKLPNGSRIDATGGWHSAGDYNKPMWQFGDSGVSYSLATALESRPQHFGRLRHRNSQLGDALEEAWWGAKFLARMQNPADGSLRGDVLQGPERTWMKWLAPDVHTDNQAGTADDPVIASGTANAPLAIAAWCIVARQLAAEGIGNDYVERAERLWNSSTATESAAANPLLLIGALELDRTQNDDKYRQFARRGVELLLQSQKPSGAMPGDTGDHGDVAAAAVALFALQYDDDPLRTRIIEAMRRYLDFCITRTDNPFGISRQGTEEPEATYFHPTVGLGVNFWILSRAWAALLIHELTHDPRAVIYATDQIDWVLGKNPLNLCMFEGCGKLNPPRYHHRYNMIAGRERGAVPGAIANGVVRDMGLVDRPGFDMSRVGSRPPSFRTSEPWLVHNMFYLLAASQLDRSVNGDQSQTKPQ